MVNRLASVKALLVALSVVLLSGALNVHAQTFTPPELTTLSTNDMLVNILLVVGMFAGILVSAWVIRMAPGVISGLRRAFR